MKGKIKYINIELEDPLDIDAFEEAFHLAAAKERRENGVRLTQPVFASRVLAVGCVTYVKKERKK